MPESKSGALTNLATPHPNCQPARFLQPHQKPKHQPNSQLNQHIVTGFTLNYKGSHTIYEHEHLVSIRPGEFNYSTNPTSFVQTKLLFDVNQDGKFDFLDVDLIMRYLYKKKFFEEFVFDDKEYLTI